MQLQRLAAITSAIWLGLLGVAGLFGGWFAALLTTPMLLVVVVPPALALLSLRGRAAGLLYWAASLSNLLLLAAGIVLLGLALTDGNPAAPRPSMPVLAALCAFAVTGLNSFALLLRPKDEV